MLFPAAAFAVHQLRYELGYGSALERRACGAGTRLPDLARALGRAARWRSRSARSWRGLRAPPAAAPTARRGARSRGSGCSRRLPARDLRGAGVARGPVRGRAPRRASRASSGTAAGGRSRSRSLAGLVVAALLRVAAAVAEVVSRLAPARRSPAPGARVLRPSRSRSVRRVTARRRARRAGRRPGPVSRPESRPAPFPEKGESIASAWTHTLRLRPLVRSAWPRLRCPPRRRRTGAARRSRSTTG